MLVCLFDDHTAQRIVDLFPTSRVLPEGIGDIQPNEWDLVVTRTESVGPPDNLYVVGFGNSSFGYVDVERTQYSAQFDISHTEWTLSQEFQIPDDLPPDVRGLIERDLVPLALSRERNLVMTQVWRTSHQRAAAPDEPWLTPFLTTTEGTVLWGAIRRPGGGAEAWCLPGEILDPVPWVKAAVRAWHELDPSHFPFDPGWPSEPRWMTNREAGLTADIARLKIERQNFIDQSDAQQKALEDEFAATADDAEHGQRRLLTAQGDDLVDEVEAALVGLGFVVENRDRINPENARLEDLRVTAPGDDPDWIALAEVRGYSSGGAATGDLLRLGRFVDRFRDEKGGAPSRRWYIVNQFTRRDPGTRPPPFATSPDDLATFEGQDGMVLDTSNLFLLVKDVEAGRIYKDATRRTLMKASGRYVYEST